MNETTTGFKGTAGEWRRGSSDQGAAIECVYAPEGWLICEVDGNDYDEAEANAQLIEAAPPMLYGFEEIVDLCSREKGLTVSGAFVDQIEAIATRLVARALGAAS